jgi:hypothetical protein
MNAMRVVMREVFKIPKWQDSTDKTSYGENEKSTEWGEPQTRRGACGLGIVTAHLWARHCHCTPSPTRFGNQSSQRAVDTVASTQHDASISGFYAELCKRKQMRRKAGEPCSDGWVFFLSRLTGDITKTNISRRAEIFFFCRIDKLILKFIKKFKGLE